MLLPQSNNGGYDEAIKGRSRGNFESQRPPLCFCVPCDKWATHPSSHGDVQVKGVVLG